MKELAKKLAEMSRKPPESDAYNAGRDCGINGANTTNCHFRYLGSKELTREWERGKRDGDAEKGK